mgnify:CR=1 FL=1
METPLYLSLQNLALSAMRHLYRHCNIQNPDAQAAGIKTNNFNTDKTMYETEETSDIIGAYCTLIEDYQGICDAQIVGDYGTEVVVRLSNGIEMATHRDEVIVFD